MNILHKIIRATIGVALLALAACKPDDIKEPENPTPGSVEPYLVIKTDPLHAPVGGKNFVLEVKSNKQVVVESSEDWCEPTLMHDPLKSDIGSLKISVEKTDEAVERTATVTLSAEGCEAAVITVAQDHRVFSSEKSLKSLAIKKAKNTALKSDINFAYDAQTKTFSAMYLKWIDAEKPEMLKPTFEFEGIAVLVGETELQSEKTAVSFADDFKIAVKAEDGSVIEYTVSLNCPQINTELPVLHMKPDQLISGKSTYVQTAIELYDKTPGSTGEGWWDSDEKGKIEMRGRGNSTWGLPKKPFRMKFPDKFSPIGLNHAKEKSWVLLAQDMDKSLLRTHLAFEYSRILFNKNENYHHEKCLNWTPCSRYINVYYTGKYYYSDTGKTLDLDGEYIGVYQMSDQMERKSGRIEVDKLEAADGNDPEKITGGYILETDIHEGNHYTPKKNIKMTYKYPEDDDYHQSQYDYISNFLGSVENALYGSNYKDATDGWRKYLDEKTMADFIIIKEFVGDMDGYTSTYMYKRRGYDKLFFGPVWDCDKGWDNDVRVPHNQYQPLKSLMLYAGFWMPSYVSNDWFQKVWSDPEFRKFVAARWAAKKGELKAKTEEVLTEVPAKMAKAIEANFKVWPFYYQYSSEAKMPAKTYELEIERIRTLSAQREALLDTEFNK